MQLQGVYQVTGKERLFAAITGKDVDRPPIWLREGFNIGGPILGEPLLDVLGEGGDTNFTTSWKLDPQYQELFEFLSPHVEVIRSWDIGSYINRYLMIPPKYIKRCVRQIDKNTIMIDGTIETQNGVLTFKDQLTRGFNTYWHVEHPVKSIEDLKKLAEIPFVFDAQILGPFINKYHQIKQDLDNRGIMRLEYPSPIVAISATMKLEDLLMFSVTENGLFHELLEEITRRLLVITDELFANRDLETLVNFGGSEQCTPPLMSPESFDGFVVPYDGRIIDRLVQYGVPVNMHCHGKVRHALRCMMNMGVNSTDPVEPPPAGDITFTEARELTKEKLTLIGNLEFDELAHRSQEHIKQRVSAILSHGYKRLVLAASTGPIHALTSRTMANYKSWIETYLDHTGK
jgi:uroporphyrinogen-III decarboxylase